MLRSLRNRLALVFFAVTFVAFAALYLYVAPGLQNRLLDEKLKALAATASTYSRSIAVGTNVPRTTVERQVEKRRGLQFGGQAGEAQDYSGSQGSRSLRGCR